MKRDLYEGGIRVPLIAYWPGKIKPQQISDHVSYFGDMMATFSALAGVKSPAGLDSISLVPTLLGETGLQQTHPYLYWEFFEQGGKQAVRSGKWKGVRKPWAKGGKLELYDLDEDIGETTDVALRHPEQVKKLEQWMDEAHRDHPNWQVK